MLMELDFGSDTPIYRQIYRFVIDAIACGKLSEGQSLPTVRRLAEEIGVNMHTVNKAYALLKSEGYVEMNRRKGAIVCAPTHGDQDLARIWEALKGAAAQAKGKNVKKEKFIEMCELAYDDFEGGIINGNT